MRLIELHILQSFPVSCLNRDDIGSPKTAEFGGVPRARISSQCLKRATREFAQANYPAARFNGVRSRRLLTPFLEALKEAGLSAEEAQKKADEIREALSKIDSKDKELVTTAVFLSPGEIKQIAKEVAGGTEAAKAVKKANRLDAADIALFGRMIANDASLNIEAASMFGHALSTHASENEIDFFSAVDERKREAEDAGAGMIGTIEFSSAIYYRYVGLNLDQLAAKSHLGDLTLEDRRAIVEAFIRSALLAVPGARRHSMNADTLPGFVLGLAKEQGQPLQLVNAFLDPVTRDRKSPRLLDRSVDALQKHYLNLKRVWGIESRVELTLTESGETTVNEFVKALTAYVC